MWITLMQGTCVGTHSIDQALVLFGVPSSVTAFFRAQRGIESEVEDSFTIILQYASRDLLVTVKTSVTTPLAQQVKFIVRGTKGSYVKVRGPQGEHTTKRIWENTRSYPRLAAG